MEINTREHQPRFGRKAFSFAIKNEWFSAETEVLSFEPSELFGTKLRALLQRNKNRDLFDLAEGLGRLNLEPDKVIDAFSHYTDLEGHPISRAQAEERMLRKLTVDLIEDVSPLLPPSVVYNEDDAWRAFELVWASLIVRLGGEQWKGSPAAIAEFRKDRPNFLREVIE